MFAGLVERCSVAVDADRGYATAKLSQSVLSGICGWSVRRGVLSANPVRDLTPLGLDQDRTARAMSVQEMRDWLALLDADEFAQRHDLPELARFMLATGLRLGEALGVHVVRRRLGSRHHRGATHGCSGQGRGAGRQAGQVAGVRAGLLLPPWCVELLRARRVRLAAFDGPVFPDARGGWRDRSNVGRAVRSVRGGSDSEWVKTHTYRKTVATLLDQSGVSARMIADQLDHSRVSMTQDVYLGRRAGNAGNLAALEAYNPDPAARPVSGEDGARGAAFVAAFVAWEAFRGEVASG